MFSPNCGLRLAEREEYSLEIIAKVDNFSFYQTVKPSKEKEIHVLSKVHIN